MANYNFVFIGSRNLDPADQSTSCAESRMRFFITASGRNCFIQIEKFS